MHKILDFTSIYFLRKLYPAKKFVPGGSCENMMRVTCMRMFVKRDIDGIDKITTLGMSNLLQYRQQNI